MGKGKNKGRRQASTRQDEDCDDSGDDDADTPNPNLKDLDFAQRRALQRQQAAEKRRSKQKCYLCGRAGHVRRQCPGIADDGRGMSHYKGKSDKSSEKQKLMERRRQRGSSGNHEAVVADMMPHYPQAFRTDLEVVEGSPRSSLRPLQYHDVHCDIAASIEYLRFGRGKAKISHKAAVSEYRQALFLATPGLRSMIAQTQLLKPGRAWTNPLKSELGLQDDDDDDDIQVRVFFALGLTDSFKCDDEVTRNAATEGLVTTIQEHSDQILAIGVSTLDYRPETVTLLGNDSDSQMHRLRACWEAAGRAKVPWQLRLLPGAASLDPEDSVAGTDYAKVLLDAQEQIAAAIALYPSLSIHIVGWCGKAAHLMALLQAFPNNLRAIGVDGTVSFKSRSDLHECAFEIPLDRLLLETSTIIPSQVNNRLGRTAFFHSGWWPFVAESVAHHKKTASLEQIVEAVNTNAEKLYPKLAETTREEHEEEGERSTAASSDEFISQPDT